MCVKTYAIGGQNLYNGEKYWQNYSSTVQNGPLTATKLWTFVCEVAIKL